MKSSEHSRPLSIPISWKLLAATIIVGIVSTGLAIYGLRRMNALNERLTRLVDYSSEKVKLAALLKQDLISITRAEKNLILAPTVEEMQRLSETIEETLAAMAEHQKQLAALADAEDKEDLATFAEAWSDWQKTHLEVRSFAQLKSDVRARRLALSKGKESYERWEHGLNDVKAKLMSETRITPARNNPEQLLVLMQKLDLVAKLLADAARIQRAEKQLILSGTADELEQSESDLPPIEKQIAADFDALHELADETERQAVAEAEDAFNSYLEVLAEIRAVLNLKGDFFVYQLAYEVGGPLATKCELLLDEIIDRNELDLQTSRAESERTYINSRNALWAFSALCIIISVTVTYFTGQNIANNLTRLTEYTRAVQDSGDLSKPVPRVSHDEVGVLADAFDHLRQSLHRQTTELETVNNALAQKSKEMEQFVYTVSHDLSSPLVSCKGLAGLIREDAAAGNFDEVVSSARRLDGAVDQLRHIIDDLLTLSRIGRKPLQLTPVDVQELVEELKQTLALRLRDVGAELEIESPLAPVVADPTDLRRVFENLLTNAIKYGCKGANSVITVGSRVVNGEVRYFISDQGPGIDPRYHEQIFGLFQRLDTDQPGTGVGLASVAKVMRMHGGTAWVESAPGKGATFWVAFPGAEGHLARNAALPIGASNRH